MIGSERERQGRMCGGDQGTCRHLGPGGELNVGTESLTSSRFDQNCLKTNNQIRVKPSGRHDDKLRSRIMTKEEYFLGGNYFIINLQQQQKIFFSWSAN